MKAAGILQTIQLGGPGEKVAGPSGLVVREIERERGGDRERESERERERGTEKDFLQGAPSAAISGTHRQVWRGRGGDLHSGATTVEKFVCSERPDLCHRTPDSGELPHRSRELKQAL